MSSSAPATPPSAIARLFKVTAAVEPHEVKAVVLSFLYFFFLLGSYYILRPVRDAMGTVYGDGEALEVLYTFTFFATFICAPIYGAFASRLKLATFLPWVYGFFVINILIFYAVFEAAPENHTVAGVFFVWVSVFNMFITSVFWSFMSDIFSRTEAKRLFGFIAGGGSAGAAAGPAITALLVTEIGTNNLLLISAAGFVVVMFVIRMLENEKTKLMARGGDAQRTTLDRKLEGNPFDGFTLLFKSPFLLSIAMFILMLTWVSTILYFQQNDLVRAAFETREQRTQAFAVVDLIVNVGAILIQLFGTGRLVSRFGVTFALVLVPVVMIFAFVAIAFSPVVFVLLGVQVMRRISEYAVSRPGREMLFTVVDQQSRYKAKNVIDTVVYRFGDVSAAWVTAGLTAAGLATSGVAIFGVLVAAVWGFIALRLGRSYETVNAGSAVGRPAAAAAE
ncbi:MAG: Npt1/Npt2 family nucleotide transporter [Rhodospirillaceae bacterium]|nr:Npt1/Npt2 family nucleotide transporter [Rhodospirillaceae bacterium]